MKYLYKRVRKKEGGKEEVDSTLNKLNKVFVEKLLVAHLVFFTLMRRGSTFMQNSGGNCLALYTALCT
jgi:hypothetical protein